MNIFDILAEAKIREFESNRDSRQAKAGEYAQTDSFEKQLLHEIHDLIQSGEEGSVEKARELEIQLMASLEKQGLNLTAKRIADEISEMVKNRACRGLK